MIHILINARNAVPQSRLRRSPADVSGRISTHTYQRVFSRQSIPAGTLVFTDFDLLHGFELDAAALIAETASRTFPGIRILNHPARALERYELLRKLNSAGLSVVEAVRLDTGELPRRYPVFIRSEDGWSGPETQLIHNEADYRKAVQDLRERGQPLKRRIAVTFASDPDADGFFRKYGAFVIGDRIIPQHILRGSGWVVKSRFNTYDERFAREEEAYVNDNPHGDALRRIAETVGIGFGRIDYGFSDGKLVVFEINLNPTFPRLSPGADPIRQGRRDVIAVRLGEALAEIGSPEFAGEVRFDLSRLPGQQFIEREAWYQDLPHSVLSRERWSRFLGSLKAGKNDRGGARPAHRTE